MTCKTCRFFLVPDEKKTTYQDGTYRELKEDVGYCRRYPKTELKESSDWCGEFNLKDSLLHDAIKENFPGAPV